MCEKALMADAAAQHMKHQLDQLKVCSAYLTQTLSNISNQEMISFNQAQAEQTLGTINQTLNETRELDGTKTIEQVLNLKTKIEEIQDVHRKGEIDLANHELNHERDDQNLLEEEKADEVDSPVSSKYASSDFYISSILIRKNDLPEVVVIEILIRYVGSDFTIDYPFFVCLLLVGCRNSDRTWRYVRPLSAKT